MAFKNAGGALTTSATTIYTCPALSEAVVHSLLVSNVSGLNSASVTIEVVKSGGSPTYNLGFNLPVPVQSTLIVDKPINLEAGDYIQLTADANASLGAFASILEQLL